MTLLLFLRPPKNSTGDNNDTGGSWVHKKYSKNKLKKLQRYLLEEDIAAQILRARLEEDIEIPEIADKTQVAKILEQEINSVEIQEAKAPILDDFLFRQERLKQSKQVLELLKKDIKRDALVRQEAFRKRQEEIARIEYERYLEERWLIQEELARQEVIRQFNRKRQIHHRLLMLAMSLDDSEEEENG